MPGKSFKTLVAFALGISICASSLYADESAPDSNAQTALQNVLADQKYPLSVQLQEMDATWRRVLIDEKDATALDMQLKTWVAVTGVELGVYFTKGQIAQIGENSYLVAYQLPINIDKRFLNWHGHGPAPRPRKPDAETVLSLSLLNMKSIGSMNDARPFNPQIDMVNDKQSRADSVKALEQLGQGVLRYIRARGKFPILRNPMDWNATRVFYPYVGDERLFMHPGTQEMYRYNEILGGKKAAHIPNKQSFVVFYEASPAEDETRAALFLDGHVERLSPAHWENLKLASKIINEANNPFPEITDALPAVPVTN